MLDLGRDLAQTNENQKNVESRARLKVFWGLGNALGGHAGSSWRYVGLCLAMLAPSLPSIGLSLAILALMLGHLGGKLGPESAKKATKRARCSQAGRLQGPRREVCPGVGGKSGVLGPLQSTKQSC